MSRNFLILVLSAILLGHSFTACKEAEKPGKEETTLDTASLKKGPLSDEEFTRFVSIGNEIAEVTFKTMSATLQEAIASGGVKEAVSYCNVEALKITDSLSTAHDARIKRTALKWRNHLNKPTEDELDILNRYSQSLQNNLAVEAFALPFKEDSVKFYAPIMTQKLCLVCHGPAGNELNAENEAFLKELYPEDQATGFREGELRGIWAITMPR